jgi:hypothetical protein
MNQETKRLISELRQIAKDASREGPLSFDVEAYINKALEQMGVKA